MFSAINSCTLLRLRIRLSSWDPSWIVVSPTHHFYPFLRIKWTSHWDVQVKLQLLWGLDRCHGSCSPMATPLVYVKARCWNCFLFWLALVQDLRFITKRHKNTPDLKRWINKRSFHTFHAQKNVAKKWVRFELPGTRSWVTCCQVIHARDRMVTFWQLRVMQWVRGCGTWKGSKMIKAYPSYIGKFFWRNVIIVT